MGLILRCTACAGEMVLESYHRGRTVPCPRCRAENHVPQNIDFLGPDTASARDEASGTLLMVLAVASLASCCLPLCAWVWWAAAGKVQRARDEQREPDPLVVNARLVAIIATAVLALVWLGAAGTMLARVLG